MMASRSLHRTLGFALASFSLVQFFPGNVEAMPIEVPATTGTTFPGGTNPSFSQQSPFMVYTDSSNTLRVWNLENGVDHILAPTPPPPWDTFASYLLSDCKIGFLVVFCKGTISPLDVKVLVAYHLHTETTHQLLMNSDFELKGAYSVWGVYTVNDEVHVATFTQPTIFTHGARSAARWGWNDMSVRSLRA